MQHQILDRNFLSRTPRRRGKLYSYLAMASKCADSSTFKRVDAAINLLATISTLTLRKASSISNNHSSSTSRRRRGHTSPKTAHSQERQPFTPMEQATLMKRLETQQLRSSSRPQYFFHILYSSRASYMMTRSWHVLPLFKFSTTRWYHLLRNLGHKVESSYEQAQLLVPATVEGMLCSLNHRFPEMCRLFQPKE